MIEFDGNPLGEAVFKHKYALSPSQSWAEKARHIVEDVCGKGVFNQYPHPLLGKEERDFLVECIKNKWFIPGGRYVYYAGREARFYNNCFGAETRVLTDEGWRKISSLGQANVFSPVDGQYYPATFHKHGKQQLNKITFALVRGHQKYTQTVRATRQHHWKLADGSDTYDLRVGDVVPTNSFSAEFDLSGFVHGFVFGDGNSNGQLRLCAAKDKAYLNLLSSHSQVRVSYPPSAKGDPVLYFGNDPKWKQLPDEGDTVEYIASFIKGWLAADGSQTAGNKLCSINKEAMEWFREHAAFAGIVITGNLRSQVRDVTLGEYEYKDHEIYIQNYQYGDVFSGFKVISIEPDQEEEVYCPYEPVHNRIVIDNGIDTYQCFLLRAEEDTREEWGALTKRAMDCLMTGGGIGADYSILRPEGRLLSRTGGVASGPIPLMKAINEIGRNVMQGGSRRSAIYASLNWQHEDIDQFLVAKNWDEMKIGNSGYTYADYKMDDFNAPAPLDMTNISVNYDDAWLNSDRLDPVFMKNVEQAMRNGEPGFSFNFGDKQNETLRNACTEVTSEDDSDVCNLGSINLGSIPNVDVLRNVVRVASKFLVCGTIRADLPYEKVHVVREKNRRLGLGLMGVHEWLLKRGKRYEVDEELRAWLEIYKSESEDAANEHCDRLYLSRPVAYRAIAPTGTIAIIAGTTSGIEPLYAVAYKRRYLVGGGTWKYQYKIDGVAELMIKQGVNPALIESAADLAADPERRIKFQADVQDYVDMAISSTLNLPAWGTSLNNPDKVVDFAQVVSKYAPRLRGLTFYPDGSRGGQPLESVPYEEALAAGNAEFEENSACRDGVCGI